MDKKHPLTIKEAAMLWVIRNLTLEEVFVFDILLFEGKLKALSPTNVPDFGKDLITKVRKRTDISCDYTMTLDTQLKIAKLEEYYRQLYDMAFPAKPPISKWSIEQFKTRYNLNKRILKGSEIMREGNRC